MKRFLSIKIVALFVSFFAVSGSFAQAIRDVRINEILVKNVDNFQDDYGHRVGWIELFNSGYSKVDIGGSYLKVRGKEYRIPKNDPRTVIAPQGYIVFFAEGTASKGTFHTNFTLDETDYIAFYDQSGRGTAIDSVHYNIDRMKEDVSIGWFEGADGKEIFGELAATTPLATNNTLEKEPRSEHFRRADPSGIVMALTAMTVVFCALIALYLIFKRLGKFLTRTEKKKKEQEAQSNVTKIPSARVVSEGEIAGEEVAAIAIALYKYSEELHDIENTVLTINRVAKAYSPWSSKIYGLRQIPNKK